MTAPSLRRRVYYRPLLCSHCSARRQSSPLGPCAYQAGRICAAGLPHVPQRAELDCIGPVLAALHTSQLASMLQSLAPLPVQRLNLAAAVYFLPTRVPASGTRCIFARHPPISAQRGCSQPLRLQNRCERIIRGKCNARRKHSHGQMGRRRFGRL